MARTPIFHPRIEDDVRDAMARYEEVSPELGQRFKRTFYAAVDEILVFPEKYAVKLADVRTPSSGRFRIWFSTRSRTTGCFWN